MAVFGMCRLLMCVVSDKIIDGYNCLHDFVPTNPNKLVKELIKIENKLESNKYVASLRKRGQAWPYSDVQAPNKDKHRKKGG